MGVQVAIVVGGGNIWRGGRQGAKMNRSRADHMGMLATVINALALQQGFEEVGAESVVMTAIDMERIADPFTQRDAVKNLEEGKIVIFGGGTGCPYFSTDTGAVLRAAEINADALLKATNVDGIYDKDPKKHTDAVKIDEITYLDVLNKKLNVMDTTATTLCMDNEIPIVVFDINEHGNLKKVVEGETIGTIVKNKVEE